MLTLVVCIDIWLVRHHKPTLSRTLGHFARHPLLGPVLAGAWAGLTYHLLVLEEEGILVASRGSVALDKPL